MITVGLRQGSAIFFINVLGFAVYVSKLLNTVTVAQKTAIGNTKTSGRGYVPLSFLYEHRLGPNW